MNLDGNFWFQCDTLPSFTTNTIKVNFSWHCFKYENRVNPIIPCRLSSPENGRLGAKSLDKQKVVLSFRKTHIMGVYFRLFQGDIFDLVWQNCHIGT